MGNHCSLSFSPSWTQGSWWPAVEDVFEATCGAPMLCPVGLYLPSNQCFPAVQTAFQQCDRSWRRKSSCDCAYVPFYNVHLSCASQASRACAVLVYSMSSCCPHVPCAKMPPSSPSPAAVLLPASHTSCVWPNCILYPFGAFLPFARTNLVFPLPHCCPAWGMWCMVAVHQGQLCFRTAGRQGWIFSADIHVYMYTLGWSQKSCIYMQTHFWQTKSLFYLQF